MNAQVTEAQPSLRDTLSAALGDGLHSLILYGSSVRGGFEKPVSDINLLIVLRETTPELHLKLRDALKGEPRVQPMIVGLPDLPRTLRAFGLKFLSIKRSYRVLHGADVLADFTLDRADYKRLTEEALRNLQLRLSRSFVVLSPQPQRYTAYLLKTYSSLMVNLAEALRLQGTEVPVDFAARLPVLTQHYGADASALAELAGLRHKPHALSAEEELALHSRLLALVTRALRDLERA